MSRFAVEWLVPNGPDRLTHVMLLDRERPAPYTVAVGNGADKMHALLNLWETLIESNAAAEAIHYVAAELHAPHRRSIGGIKSLTLRAKRIERRRRGSFRKG